MNPQRLLPTTLLIAVLALAACGGAAAEPTEVLPTEALEPTRPEPTRARESTQAHGASEDVIVNVVDSSFADATITLTVGTTVTWAHIGQLPHTVTADDGSFDSGTLTSGATFSHTFGQAGTYAYYCKFHGRPGGVGMSGTVIVGD